MICLFLYVVVGIVIAFFMHKSYERKLRWNKDKHGPVRYNSPSDEEAFLNTAITSAFWIFVIPVKAFWALLEFIYNKFNKPNNTNQP